MAPQVEAGSLIAQDDNRVMARRHPDLTVRHQAESRLWAAMDHLTAHGLRWGVRAQHPPMHIYSEFTVLRGTLEIAAAMWWLLEPGKSSRNRVSRALGAKKEEARFESQAAKSHNKKGAKEFEDHIRALLLEASQEVGLEPEPFPRSTRMVDSFGHNTQWASLVGAHWRLCSSYAHGFDWGAWHHRTFGEEQGITVSPVPYEALAEAFVVACDALDLVWSRAWLPLALGNPPSSESAGVPFRLWPEPPPRM